MDAAEVIAREERYLQAFEQNRSDMRRRVAESVRKGHVPVEQVIAVFHPRPDLDPPDGELMCELVVCERATVPAELRRYVAVRAALGQKPPPGCFWLVCKTGLTSTATLHRLDGPTATPEPVGSGAEALMFLGEPDDPDDEAMASAMARHLLRGNRASRRSKGRDG
jgi:hypothetical protein